MSTVTPEDILTYWFGELTSDTDIPGDRLAFWFSKDSSTDYFIRQAYEPVVTAAAQGQLAHWKEEPRSSLAWILVLDQFPRNVYRDMPAAYELDPAAQIQSLEGIEAGFDRQLRPLERVFYYLPLEHAEDIECQERSVELFTDLRAEAPPEVDDKFRVFLEYAQEHRDVIARFGRFPHRNAVLGRESTPEEVEYLAAGGGF